MTADAERGQELVLPMKRFEVTMFGDRSEEVAALHGLARTYSWDVQEFAEGQSDPTPNQLVVGDEELFGISQANWDTADYGLTAAQILKNAAEAVTFSVVRSRSHLDGEYSVRIKGGSYPYNHIPFRSLNKAHQSGPRHLTDFVAKQLANKSIIMPFELGFEAFGADPGQADQDTLLMVKPRPVTRQSLANYMVRKRLNIHKLSGTLGKTLDVLNMAADNYTEPRSIELFIPADFTVVDDLIERAKSEGLSLGVRRTITGKIRRILGLQLETGRPFGHGGEIVVEGAYDPSFDSHTKKNKFMTGLKIARPSLRILAADYVHYSPAVKFLRAESVSHTD